MSRRDRNRDQRDQREQREQRPRYRRNSEKVCLLESSRGTILMVMACLKRNNFVEDDNGCLA